MAQRFSAFIHAGLEDNEAPPSMSRNNKNYFEYKGVEGIEYLESPNFGHWFPDNIPFEANSFMLNNIERVANQPDAEWRDNGVFG